MTRFIIPVEGGLLLLARAGMSIEALGCASIAISYRAPALNELRSASAPFSLDHGFRRVSQKLHETYMRRVPEYALFNVTE